MTDNNNYETGDSECPGFSKGFGQKLMFFLIGGGIGATIALLFAPKPGRDLRNDIADAAGKRYDETLEAADQFRRQTTEYYQTAKAKGGEVLSVVAAGVSALKEEVSSDVEKIGAIVEGPVKTATNYAKGDMG